MTDMTMVKTLTVFLKLNLFVARSLAGSLYSSWIERIGCNLQ